MDGSTRGTVRGRLTAALVSTGLLLAGCAPGSGEGSEPAEPLPAVQVVAAGDISDCPNNDCDGTETEATARLIARIDPDLVLTLGDNQYPAGELEDFTAEYDPTWGEFLDITRPAPGNHDYATPGAAGYFDYFGDQAGSESQGYYSFDAGSWHLVALNSNDECEELACDEGSTQQRWIAQDLAESDSRCTLAYMHHPRWSTGHHGDIEEVDALWRTAVEGGVDVVLGGHEHSYERFEPLDADGEPDPGGATEFVVGTAGTPLRPFPGDPYPETEARLDDAYGVLHLRLDDGSYRWEFVDVDGEVLDSGGPVDCT